MHLPPGHSTHYGINFLLFRGSLLWNNLPREVKERLSTEETRSPFVFMRTLEIRYMLIIVTQLDKASTAQPQGIQGRMEGAATAAKAASRNGSY